MHTRQLGIAILALGLIPSCGRIRYDTQPQDASRGGADTGADAGLTGADTGPAVDAAVGDIDAGPDATAPVDAGECGGTAPECPPGMAEIAGLDARVCIDAEQSGSLTWLEARGFCAGRGKRLCIDPEWFLGCNQHSGTAALDMVDDWEWVADLVSPGVAGKRGGGASCDTTSSHAIDTDSCGIRCCLDL